MKLTLITKFEQLLFCIYLFDDIVFVCLFVVIVVYFIVSHIYFCMEMFYFLKCIYLFTRTYIVVGIYFRACINLGSSLCSCHFYIFRQAR